MLMADFSDIPPPYTHRTNFIAVGADRCVRPRADNIRPYGVLIDAQHNCTPAHKKLRLSFLRRSKFLSQLFSSCILLYCRV